MKKIYLIKTATQCCDTSAHIMHQCVWIWATNELEAVAIALNNQPEQTYIFRIEVCHPQLCVFSFNQATLIQATFNVWQDLAGEATGHDTEWGYPIATQSIAEAFHIPPNMLMVLLANLKQPELELCLTKTALTFHSPPGEVNQNAIHQQIDVVHFSDLALSQPFVHSANVYRIGNGKDLVYNFRRDAGSEKLQFEGIDAIDVVTKGGSTFLRSGGIAENNGFGQLLAEPHHT